MMSGCVMVTLFVLLKPIFAMLLFREGFPHCYLEVRDLQLVFQSGSPPTGIMYRCTAFITT